MGMRDATENNYMAHLRASKDVPIIRKRIGREGKNSEPPITEELEAG